MSFIASKLTVRMLSQDIRRDNEKRSHHDRVWDHHDCSARVWDIWGDPCGEGGR